MKSLIKKLVIVAVVVALGIAGCMIINHVGGVNNVKIQANSGSNIPTIKEYLTASM